MLTFSIVMSLLFPVANAPMQVRQAEVKDSIRVTAADKKKQASTGLRAKPKRAGSRIRLLRDREKTAIDVSGSGIGSATVTRESKHWPKKLVVRLHLRGLESCIIANQKLSLNWSVSSTGRPVSRVSLRKGRTEKVLDRKSPYFTAVRIVGGNGKLPLKKGHFEIPLPSKLLAENPKEITIRWIDFYRN